MGGFANDFFWKSLRDFRAWTSVIGLLLTGASAIIGHTILLPQWIWALMAVGCAFWIAWRAEHQLFADRHAEIKCDMSLIEVLERIDGTKLTDGVMRGRFGAVNTQRIDMALTDIRELAHHQRLKVWGRQDIKSNNYELYPRTEIPPDYWKDFSISYNSLHNDVRGQTFRIAGEPAHMVRLIPLSQASLYVVDALN
jgi:hypothetical protein